VRKILANTLALFPDDSHVGPEISELAGELEGQLTATIHGAREDLPTAKLLFTAIREKAGRIIWNGFPTGVEVCSAMQHGGPFPATSDPRFTSVGTAAILRFVRPVCFQDTPQDLLPKPLKDENPRGISRLLDGQLSKEKVQS
jgi:alpha-ketoglutaric semialdehyde dehydrogenase